MNIKPIHKALKELQASPLQLPDRYYHAFLTDEENHFAATRNEVCGTNDFYRMLDFQNSSLIPAEYVQ